MSEFLLTCGASSELFAESLAALLQVPRGHVVFSFPVFPARRVAGKFSKNMLKIALTVLRRVV